MTDVTRECYLCGAHDFSTRRGKVRDNSSLNVLECNSCGLVTLSSATHIQAGHYENSQMHGANMPPIDSWLRLADVDDQRRFEMLKALLANRKVLDFGCGAGGFLHKAKALASKVAGIELERRVLEYWGNELALYERLHDAGNDFDLITAFHVIEHSPNPRAMLKDLANCLADEGRLVIEVPSSDDALLTLYDSSAFQNFSYWSQHLFLFNAETLRRVAEQAGLRVLSIQQFQRYPLSNHMHWLSRERPDGHRQWSFLDSPALTEAYAAALSAIGKCDTLIAHLEPAAEI
jgi:2-polyprenyl-3-methyl-5-hydroxy-6-metoxy-1,4-benzoquinol methylase